MKNKKMSKFLSALLAVVMVIMAMPMSAFAAVASDLPDNMADSHILRALEYTGYDVQAQKNNSLYRSGGNHYGTGGSNAVCFPFSHRKSSQTQGTVAAKGQPKCNGGF